MARDLTRRQFLRASGGTLAAAGVASQLELLTSCGNGRASELDRLARSMEGPVLRPGDRAYAEVRPFNRRFDGIRPMAVARCESPRDVAAAIAWAREAEVPLAARAGGHSFEGYSTTHGLVVDVGELAGIEVDRNAGTARIGAGSLGLDVHRTLGRHGVGIPLGACPTIGIAGLAMGGGVGLSARKHGLTLDRLREVEIVTADGRLRRCDARHEPDLFWASRGGGGGNFGVATAFTFDVHPVRSVAVYELGWRWSDSRAVLDAWQRHAPSAPDELYSVLELKGSREISSIGQSLGPRRELEAALEPLVAAAPPTVHRVRTLGYLGAQDMWAHVPARTLHPKVAPATFKAKSDYFDKPLDEAGLDTVIRWLEAWPLDPGRGFATLILDPCGGAINRIPADATAFVHRDSLVQAQYLAYWNPTAPRGIVDRALAWIRSFHEAMRPHASGAAYQNYVDADLAGWEQAYYGSNLRRLSHVKRTYDPDDVFRFRQSIPLTDSSV